MKTNMIVLLLSLAGYGTFAQHHAKTNDEKKSDKTKIVFKDASLGTCYEQYITLKDALVASNANEAKGKAAQLQKSLATISNGSKAAAAATKIALTDNLADQRKAFAELSNEVATLLKGGQLKKGTIYREYCPMANGGSYWLSNEKAIKNPYFGDEMLTCGSVKETIQ